MNNSICTLFENILTDIISLNHFNLKSNKPHIKSMKILFHIEVHTRGKAPIQWKEEFTKTFEYQNFIH